MLRSQKQEKLRHITARSFATGGGALRSGIQTARIQLTSNGVRVSGMMPIDAEMVTNWVNSGIDAVKASKKRKTVPKSHVGRVIADCLMLWRGSA